MTATRYDQARLLLKLRDVRLTRANRHLAEARETAARADAQARAAEAAADDAAARLVEDRQLLAIDLGNTDARLAAADRSDFLRSLARTAADDAADHRRTCEEVETERRRAMIAARTRRDRVQDEALSIARGLACADEERVAIEIEEAGRRS